MAAETSTQRERRLVVRAGLFVALGLLLFGLVILRRIRSRLTAKKSS